MNYGILCANNSLSRRTFNPMVAWTYSSQPAGTNYASAHVVARHAYSVLGWDYVNGEKYIVLRNPWGTHHATLDTQRGDLAGIPGVLLGECPLEYQWDFFNEDQDIQEVL